APVLTRAGARARARAARRARALPLDLQRAIAHRREPQHALVAHAPAGARTRRLEIAVRAIDQLGVHAARARARLRAQLFQRLLRGLVARRRTHAHQHLAPVQHLARHAEQGALLERARVLAAATPGLGLLGRL